MDIEQNPCINCLVFPICKSLYIEYDVDPYSDSYERLPLQVLMHKCRLIRKYMFRVDRLFTREGLCSKISHKEIQKVHFRYPHTRERYSKSFITLNNFKETTMTKFEKFVDGMYNSTFLNLMYEDLIDKDIFTFEEFIEDAIDMVIGWFREGEIDDEFFSEPFKPV
jgi:hypothetical protein